ncbi:DNA recombination protein RmuC [Flavobacterium sp. CBA20B-1]|uniref:DNA recombination protein RmuC n=1 Tax=unclassified Flavobacterium TaxID=196869 RepID=UPI002224BC2D|nr:MULTISPECIES: DNA recombination protein RmuC [unclassified Flavobacterium]WCM41864.1 DNA recombination protein RmuC [Flavobacterium sp. CBA20B-1]
MFTISQILVLVLFVISLILINKNIRLKKTSDAKEQMIHELENNHSLLLFKNSELTDKCEMLLKEMEVLQEQNKLMTHENYDAKTTNRVLKEKMDFQKAEIAHLHKQTTLQFEHIAQKLLEEKAERFTKTNQENIDAVLKPLNENIERFKKQVEETYEKESKIRFSLDERIKELLLQTNKISTEANNLANALKTNHKKQGDWGEVILENILQQSGLCKNREYRVQHNLVMEGKNVRPDIIIDLPDQKSIVIDSKVSLNAYDAYCQTENVDEQTIHLNNHLKALRIHIEELSNKNYQNLVSGLDFTMMFIPIEPAYLLAIQQDSNLWNEAYKKRILLISPTNLIACLKLISDLWNRDKQDKSAQKIVKQAEKIYEKTVLFTKSFEQVGKQIQQAQDSYLKAQNQLREGRGNILSQTNHLLKYGISPKNILNDFNDEEDSEY